MLGPGRPEAGEYLHMAAIAALTEVAVVEARDETEQTLRGSFLEEALTRTGSGPGGRAAAGGPARLRPRRRLHGALRRTRAGAAPGRLVAALAAEVPGVLAQPVDGKVYALLPGAPDLARRVATRLGRHATVGLSSHYAQAADLTRAASRRPSWCWASRPPAAAPPVAEIGGGTYRLLFRVMASHPQEVRSFYEDTVAALVRYDEQYATDLLGTLDAYLENNCNMNATAQAIHAHRHTVGYRLERVKELTGLDPLHQRGSRAPRPRPQGVPHHRAVAAALGTLPGSPDRGARPPPRSPGARGDRPRAPSAATRATRARA